jgi:hypothetical protein|tara:strand:+ start:295 stop:690 length:396 start_codon:yes stop_codon:yes gene_type:complete
MGYLKNQSVLMDQDRTIEPAGTRCRLYGIQVGVYSTDAGKVYTGNFNETNGRNVILKTGSASGSTLFDVAIPFVTSGYYVGELPIVFTIDPNYVLFEDGIFMKAISDVSNDTDNTHLNKDTTRLSLFYELG